MSESHAIDQPHAADDLHAIKCPKCNDLLDAYLKKSLSIDLTTGIDAKTKKPVQTTLLSCTLECPKCKEPLNDFLMKSFDTSFADEAPTQPLPHHPKAAAHSIHPKDFIVWEEKLNIGIDIIDKQHQKLAGIINKLHAAVSTGRRDAKFIPEIIAEMVSYTVEHFQTEEKLQIGTRYPGLEQHRLQHKDFVLAAANLQKDFKNGVVSLSPVLEFVKGWFIEHSQGSDRLFTKYLMETRVPQKQQ